MQRNLTSASSTSHTDEEVKQDKKLERHREKRIKDIDNYLPNASVHITFPVAVKKSVQKEFKETTFKSCASTLNGSKFKR